MMTLDHQFVSEARELLQRIGDGFLALEKTPGDTETVRQIFRAVHTLKGASGIFERLGPLTRVVHAGEDLLDRVRDGRLALTPDLTDEFLDCFDHVAEWLDAFDGTGALDAAADATATALAARLRARAEAEEAPADAAPPGTEPVAWLAAVADRAALTTATVAVTYRPDPQVFFQGDDPLLTVKTAPDLVWVDVRPATPWPALADLDPFAANLEFRLLSAAAPEALAEHFRYVADQVRLCPLPADVALAAGPVPADVGALLAELSAGLRVAGPPDIAQGRIASSARILTQAGGLDPRAVAAATATAARAADPGLLADFITTALAAPEELPESVPEGASEGGAAGREAATGAGRKTDSIKIDQERLDALMDMVGELAVVKNGLPFLARKAEEEHGNRQLSREIRAQYDSLNRVANALQASVMRMRMIPVSSVFNRFNRLVRDIARKLDKDIVLVLSGEDTEADKTVVEELADPLVHLIRNACDHGLETRDGRARAGKAITGTLTLSARGEDDHVVIEISDDGHGIDAAAVRRKAVEKGLIDAERAQAMSERDAIQLILLPGFSTAEAVSDLSGRGVGMDVVKAMVERRGGRLDIRSVPGEGTTVRLAVPLSMALTRVMMFEVGGQTFGIPIAVISETRRVRPEDIHPVRDQECIVRRDRVITLKRMARALGLEETAAASSVTDPAVLILTLDGEETALVVDRFHEGIDLVVKPMEGVLASFPMYSGTALLGDGRVLPVFNARELVRCL